MRTSELSSQRKDEALSELLRLKRVETPSKEFWDTFQQEFKLRQHTNQSHVLSNFQRAKARLTPRAAQFLSYALVGSAAALAFIVYATRKDEAPLTASQEEPTFVVNDSDIPEGSHITLPGTEHAQSIPVSSK